MQHINIITGNTEHILYKIQKIPLKLHDLFVFVLRFHGPVNPMGLWFWQKVSRETISQYTDTSAKSPKSYM